MVITNIGEIHYHQENKTNGGKQFVKKVPFKIEDLTELPSVLQKGDFSLQDRSSGRLSDDPCCKESKSVPAVSLERQTLPVHLPVLRTGFLTKNFYQMRKATTGLSSDSWGASAGLPGRYPNNGSYKGAMFGTDPANHRIIGEARLRDKSRGISAKEYPEFGIPRVCNRGGWGYSDRFSHIFFHTDCTISHKSITSLLSNTHLCK